MTVAESDNELPREVAWTFSRRSTARSTTSVAKQDATQHVVDEIVKSGFFQVTENLSLKTEPDVKAWVRVFFVRDIECYGADKESILKLIAQYAIDKKLVSVIDRDDKEPLVVVEVLDPAARAKFVR